MTWGRIFGIVTLGALGGMVMGGAFGMGAGLIAPTLFRHIIPWTDVEPMGFAVILGGAAGVLLGGGLAVFAIVLQTALKLRDAR